MPEPHPSFEPEPLPSLEAQYREQFKLWSREGVIIPLPDLSEQRGEAVGGIIGIDGQEYPFPNLQDVRVEIQGNPEKYGPKIEQGFNRLLMAPFAMPLSQLHKIMARCILRHFKEKTLLSTANEPLALDENNPFYMSDEFERADEKGSLIYYPKKFDAQNHRGRTKQEILDFQRRANSPFAGYQPLILENLPDLPRQGKGLIINGRKQIEANLSPIQYLEQFQNNAQYQHEQGMIPESWIAYFISHLNQTNQVIDDWQGKGSVCWLSGAYHPSSGCVPRADWYRNYRRAYLDRSAPDFRDESFGLRPAVSLEKFDL